MSPPPAELTRLAELEYETGVWETRRDDAEKLIERIQRAVGRPENLESDMRQRYVQLRQLVLSCRVTTRRLRERAEELVDHTPIHEGRVVALRDTQPGLVLSFGSHVATPKPRRGPVTFFWDHRRQRVQHTARAA